LHIRTVAAIIVWLVVALLLLNRLLRSEWILPIAIVLTVIALLVYFSPRLKKGKKSADKEESASIRPSNEMKF
jgi:cell division protein FtsW (lipid II flippase)